MEVGIGVLVDHRLGIEERFVPGNADGQIADRERNVGDGGEGGHGLLLLGGIRTSGSDPVTGVRMSIHAGRPVGHVGDPTAPWNPRLQARGS
jgi:hypothetical protein